MTFLTSSYLKGEEEELPWQGFPSSNVQVAYVMCVHILWSYGSALSQERTSGLVPGKA